MAIELTRAFDQARDETAFQAERHKMLVHNLAQADGTGEFNTAGIIEGSAGAAREMRMTERDAKKRRRESAETQILLTAIQSAQKIADDAARRAEAHEKSFRSAFGDDWRQDIALRIFGPDEFPLRRDNETPAEYEIRLEDELISKMIDQHTGEIKDECKGDPEKHAYAQWAQDRFIERMAKAAIKRANDPGITPEQAHAEIENLGSISAIRQAAQELSGLETTSNTASIEKAVKAATDEVIDGATTRESNLSDVGFSLGI